MAKGAMNDRWSRTSSVLALLASVNRDPKKRKRPFQPDDFNPLAGKKGSGGVPIKRSNLRMLKTLFVDKSNGS